MSTQYPLTQVPPYLPTVTHSPLSPSFTLQNIMSTPNTSKKKAEPLVR